MELFKGSAGIDITHVPYKGSAFAIQALAAGEVDMVFDTSLAMLPLTRAGKVVPVMVTGSRPFRDLPNVPPMAGLFPGVNIDAWHGVFMPAATPRAVVEQVAADLREAVFSPELAPRLADLGLEPLGLGPAAFAQTLREDRLRWQRLIRERHIRAD
jgi:tripartite-type tricarboxylate transporter receptor subunit TctC